MRHRHIMQLFKRHPTRLADFDYRTAAFCFITICIQNRRCILSRIVGEGLAPPAPELTPLGKVAEEELLNLPNRFPSVSIDKYVIMPNHIHIILTLADTGERDFSPSVSSVIGAYKSITTRKSGYGRNLFQRSFYDHIIRAQEDYWAIWKYIDENPVKWQLDKFYCN